MPSAEWLTGLVSPGSEAMEKSWGAEHRGGCRLAVRELSASLAGAGLQNHWSSMFSLSWVGAVAWDTMFY